MSMLLLVSLPVQFRDDFAHCLGGTGGGWNDVLVGTAAITPGLGTGTIHSLLGGCVSMDCGLQRRMSYSVNETYISLDFIFRPSTLTYNKGSIYPVLPSFKNLSSIKSMHVVRHVSQIRCNLP